MIYYFAYGSNLHPVRLTERVPSGELVGVASYPHHQLTFHKRSHDGSSKCNMFYSGSESDVVHGALYKINPEHKPALDRFEGLGNGYLDHQITVNCHGSEYPCFTYLAQPSHIVDNLRPYHWYKTLVVLGARYFEFPDSYIASIEAVASVEDPDMARKKEMDALIERMIDQR